MFMICKHQNLKKRSLTSEVDVGRLFSKGVCRPAMCKAYNREKYREIFEKYNSWEMQIMGDKFENTCTCTAQNSLVSLS